MLEFETTVGGKYVNGVDIIRSDADGKIVEFRVMIRPLQAVNLVHEQMRRPRAHAVGRLSPVGSRLGQRSDRSAPRRRSSPPKRARMPRVTTLSSVNTTDTAAMVGVNP